MALEIRLQSFLHYFEQGKAAVWLRWMAIVAVVGVLAVVWTVFEFNGFSEPEAMDQAQIGRQIASGRGFTTLYARPLALHLELARTGRIDRPLPETSQAPLGPVINAAALRLGGMDFAFPPGATVSPAERAISLCAVAFFAGALVLAYLLGRRLFDAQLALLGVGLLTITDLLWRFAFSGLPQMAMLFFFNGALLALVAAMDAGAENRRGRSVILALLAALLLGAVTLGNGLGLWIFAGFWVYATAVLRPRWLVALAAPAIYALPLLPWAWHNWHAVRNPFGLAFYALYRKPGADPLALVSDFEPLLRFDWKNLLVNTAEQTMDQAANLFSYLGGSIAAAGFFLAAMLHVFRRWQPAQMRWAVLLMWLGAAAGMSVFGVGRAVSVNQLHVLFLPVMTFYGLAFLLVLWSRLGFNLPLARGLFLAALYLAAAIPFLGTLIALSPRVNWPPYIPPLIVRFSQWIEPGEAMASDIPWATAWYAERVSLLLPENIGQFEIIHSENLLGAPLVAIYLTPMSGDEATYASIINGRYREWARFVLREVKPEDLASWMLRSAVNLPIDNQSIFYADRPRWR